MITKSKSLGQLIKEADDVFSEFIRLRDRTHGGFITCFICGKLVPWRKSQAMHFRDRDQMATRYDEVNVHAGCENCNCYDADHKEKYRKALITMHGYTAYNSLMIKSYSLQKFMRHELEELIADFKTRIKKLKK